MNKKLFLIPAAIAGMSLVACGGGKTPEPEPEPEGDYSVVFNSKTLTISSVALQKGKDFEATVKMNAGLISKYDMPVTLGNIQVQGGEDIKYTDYSYEINSDLESANIVIPGNLITNNLTITSEAKLVEHKLIFSKSEAFKIDKPTVGKNESLDTDIYVKDDWKGYVTIPNTLDISIGGRTLSDKEFEYNVVKQGEKAYLKIAASLIIDDIVVISTVTPDDYNVEFKEPSSCNLSINKDTSTVATDFNAKIRVTQESYVLPESITITCEDNQTGQTYTIPKTRGYYYSSSSGALTIYAAWVFGDITIDATAEEADNILEVESSTDETELLFYKDAGFKHQITDPIKIVVGQSDENYSIYVRTKDTKDENYIVPSTFDITSDGQTVTHSVKYGGVPSPIENDKHYATISIGKDDAKGHMHVYGVAQGAERHVLKVKAFCLSWNNLPEYITEPTTIECTFTPEHSYKLPLAENVNIQIDGIWYDGNGYDEQGQRKTGISYDASKGELVISKVALTGIADGSDIVIIAKPKDLSVLKYLTTGSNPRWGDLHAVSMYGYKLFTPGETTADFYLNNFPYPFQARLIGFKQERGATDTGYVQGLTLEFTTSIKQTKYYTTTKGNNIYYKKDYTGEFESRLYETLNDVDTGIVNQLPTGLRNNLYPVTKYGLTSDGSNKLLSHGYLYPLSLSEMNEKVITTDLDAKYDKESANPNDLVYDYYKQFKTKDELRKARIKGYADKATADYWLRTPDLESDESDYFIRGITSNPDIQGLADTAKQTDKGVAPAFCI